MAFNFTNPLALPAFLPAAAMVLFTYRKFKGRSFHGSIGPLVLRVLVILLLVLSLAESGNQDPGGSHRNSVCGGPFRQHPVRQDELAAFISDTLGLLPETHQAGIVSFGGNALIEQSLGDIRNFSPFIPNPIRTTVTSTRHCKERKGCLRRTAASAWF